MAGLGPCRGRLDGQVEPLPVRAVLGTIQNPNDGILLIAPEAVQEARVFDHDHDPTRPRRCRPVDGTVEEMIDQARHRTGDLDDLRLPAAEDGSRPLGLLGRQQPSSQQGGALHVVPCARHHSAQTGLQANHCSGQTAAQSFLEVDQGERRRPSELFAEGCPVIGARVRQRSQDMRPVRADSGREALRVELGLGAAVPPPILRVVVDLRPGRDPVYLLAEVALHLRGLADGLRHHLHLLDFPDLPGLLHPPPAVKTVRLRLPPRHGRARRAVPPQEDPFVGPHEHPGRPLGLVDNRAVPELERAPVDLLKVRQLLEELADLEPEGLRGLLGAVRPSVGELLDGGGDGADDVADVVRGHGRLSFCPCWAVLPDHWQFGHRLSCLLDTEISILLTVLPYLPQ